MHEDVERPDRIYCAVAHARKRRALGEQVIDVVCAGQPPRGRFQWRLRHFDQTEAPASTRQDDAPATCSGPDLEDRSPLRDDREQDLLHQAGLPSL